MKYRTFLNSALILVITIVAFSAFFGTAFAGSKTFNTSWGQMAGYTNPSGGAMRAKSASNAGAQFSIRVYMNGWGACSPDMGCSWTLKDDEADVNNFATFTDEVAFATSWTAVSKHQFQLVFGGTIATGYTSGDPTNAYGRANCWSNFSPAC